MKYNYPIKYAVMPIYEQRGWTTGLNELEPQSKIVAYIISKCYLFQEIKTYSRYNSYKTTYKVCFLYQKSYRGGWERINPNLCDLTVIEKTFDSYEEANKEKEKLNQEILNNKIINLPYDNNFLENKMYLTEEHLETLHEYQLLENQITEKTKDLTLENKEKEQTIIIIDKKNRISRVTLYEYIEYKFDENFLVYNVTEEEYEELKKQITENIDINSKYNKNLLLANYKSPETILINNYKNNHLSGLSLNFSNSGLCMKYNENLTSVNLESELTNHTIPTTIIYTTETYEDIIKSYIPDYIDNENNENDNENNENLKAYTLGSILPRPTKCDDHRCFRKNKPALTLKPSSAKIPKQRI